ncbi:hypothetical protein CARUB_v10007379mg [Capsella rubella]|uniref:Uncharacterized protein n=1 Tax=Capsella rubella TaxID=81985 RepID=R0F397_9BRAS|nr:hypothetical protein CARUB_v10007379mg [Capsella rubella]
MTTIETNQKTQKSSPSGSAATATATPKQPSASFKRWGRRHPFYLEHSDLANSFKAGYAREGGHKLVRVQENSKAKRKPV